MPLFKSKSKTKIKSKDECVIRTGSCGMANACKFPSCGIHCTPCSTRHHGNWDGVCGSSHCPKSSFDFVTSPSACHCGRPRSRSRSKSRARSKSKSKGDKKVKKEKSKSSDKKKEKSDAGCKIGCTNKKPCVSCCRGFSNPKDHEKRAKKKSKSQSSLGKRKSKDKVNCHKK